MQKLSRCCWVLLAVAALALELIALAGWQGWLGTRHIRPQVKLLDSALSRLADPLAPPAAAAEAAPAPPSAAAPTTEAAAHEEDHYAQLRDRIRWVTTRIGRGELATPDAASRMLLAKSAAQRAGLRDVGLDFKDVYGIIDAETSWVPRDGASLDGTPNLGIAQFEPATARALGLRDPHDAVEAVHVAAQHMKEAAQWSAARIDGLKLDAAERAARLREGVSVYYNLSSKGRNAWNGRNTERLPVQTRLHIRNARQGAQQAQLLDAQLKAIGAASQVPALVTAGLSPGRG
ncbi:MAG TPA: hypothetical protein VLJ58_03055 [Ramlibacter sp.]|nr:hypothetical protein [Ramlibacter sp.]